MRLRSWAIMLVSVAVVLAVGMSIGMIMSADEPSLTAEGLAGANVAVAPAANTPVPGGPGFYSVPAFACRPLDHSRQWRFDQWLLVNSGTEPSTYECPVFLPDGATVTKVGWFFEDNSASDDFVGKLIILANNAAWVSQMAYVDSSAEPPAIGVRYIEDADVYNPTIDLQSYVYLIEVTLAPTSTVKFASARIDYQFGTYAPTVMKSSN